MLILDLQDQFARKRGLAGAHPRPLGGFKFLLVAMTDAVTHTSVTLSSPLEMNVTQNPSGFFLFFGMVKARDKSTRHAGLRGWPWTIRVESDYYQDFEMTLPASPDPFASGPAASGAMSHIVLPLVPAPNYPFPDEPPDHPGGRLRGALRNPDGTPAAGVQVQALDGTGAARSEMAVTGRDGQWVLVLPTLPPDGSLTVRFTFPDGTVKDATAVRVVGGRENNFAQAVLRGQVRRKNAAVAGAVIAVSSLKGVQTLTDADGNWIFYLDVSEAGGRATVAVQLPGKSAKKSSTVTVVPRGAVFVPAFEF